MKWVSRETEKKLKKQQFISSRNCVFSVCIASLFLFHEDKITQLAFFLKALITCKVMRLQGYIELIKWISIEADFGEGILKKKRSKSLSVS